MFIFRIFSFPTVTISVNKTAQCCSLREDTIFPSNNLLYPNSYSDPYQNYFNYSQSGSGGTRSTTNPPPGPQYQSTSDSYSTQVSHSLFYFIHVVTQKCVSLVTSNSLVALVIATVGSPWYSLNTNDTG